ncbi:MAG: winged helix-turn-helix transcriptional regulator [Bdellovibrionales bacterium]|nr:winged helix-turn-helix transcriptional regulator [Bdellovibrionales bacterium]
MALARKEEFQQKEISVADFAKALSHPARVAILTTLARKGECICGELVTDLPLSQSTVSQHLKALKELGLIRGEVDGPRSRYCIDWKVFEKFHSQLSAWSDRMIQLRQDNCC